MIWMMLNDDIWQVSEFTTQNLFHDRKDILMILIQEEFDGRFRVVRKERERVEQVRIRVIIAIGTSTDQSGW